jgi:hypothetical protein
MLDEFTQVALLLIGKHPNRTANCHDCNAALFFVHFREVSQFERANGGDQDFCTTPGPAMASSIITEDATRTTSEDSPLPETKLLIDSVAK